MFSPACPPPRLLEVTVKHLIKLVIGSLLAEEGS